MNKSNITSIVLAVVGAILMTGDKITAIPGLPGWLVNAWPLFYFIATLVNRLGPALTEKK
jgi:hypothetical protein